MKLLHVSLLLAAFAAPALAQTPAERAPRLVPWTAPSASAPGRFFMGVVNPETTGSGMRFTLGATMTTPQGNNYYGIGIKLRTLSAATFRIAWQRNGQPDMDVTLVGFTSCEGTDPGGGNFAQTIMLSLGAREGLRQTGRESPGAGLGQAQVRMNAGQPSFMYECGIDSVGMSVERRIRVLIPEQHIQFGGRLAVTAVYPPPQNAMPGGLPGLPGDPPPPIASDPLVLTLLRGRPKVLVVGDSVAWGQGIPSTFKAGFRVFIDMVQHYQGGTVSFTNKAHSGATINRPDIERISDANPLDCLFQREVDGEIPRNEPTVQCQILDAVSRECFVNAQEIGVAPVPFFFCVDGLPRRGSRFNELRFNFDLGPSYHVVVMWACVNDVNAFDILAGLGSDQELTTRTATECDLRNGLVDIREFLPNAKIIVNEYHRITSQLTDLDNSDCAIQDGVIALGASMGGFPGAALALFATDAAVNRSAARSTIFRNGSTAALTASANALNQVPLSEDRRGRGSVEFLDHLIFDAARSAIWATEPLVFPLECNNEGILAATDQLRVSRADVCARLFETSAANPFRIADPNFMKCVRAAGFHPTVEANRLMARRIILQRQRFYPRMLNFNANAPAMVNPNGSIP